MPWSVGVSSHCFEITAAWNGDPLMKNEWARIELSLGDVVELRVEAAFHGDPEPPDGPGRQYALWDFEVVELFLLGDDDRYLEIELGPHGHWLGLSLAGPRVVANDWVSIDFDVEVDHTNEAWSGRARLDPVWLPKGVDRANVYAIHGVGPSRRYLAMTPVPGAYPDFHRLDQFARFLA
jgi:hypothetical protein